MTASTPAPPGIFISYRHKDSAAWAGWLSDRLASHFGLGQIFKDIDSIHPGDDFAAAISDAIASCQVLLVLIGDRWLTVADKAGRRLDNPQDFVRREIETALGLGIHVIPILLDGTTMPDADQLPPSMAGLSAREALDLSANRFDSDFGRLLEALDETLSRPQATPPRAAAPERSSPGPPKSPERLKLERAQRLAELNDPFPPD